MAPAHHPGARALGQLNKAGRHLGRRRPGATAPHPAARALVAPVAGQVHEARPAAPDAAARALGAVVVVEEGAPLLAVAPVAAARPLVPSAAVEA